ncbi:hypothetical protein GGR58DRAFT_353767 [Xylaria digitata]|nr:hypothetical protein GGR58DRAFT_353767 [Xylaria digitata]
MASTLPSFQNKLRSTAWGVPRVLPRNVQDNIEDNVEAPLLLRDLDSQTPLWQHDNAWIRLPARFIRWVWLKLFPSGGRITFPVQRGLVKRDSVEYDPVYRCQCGWEDPSKERHSLHVSICNKGPGFGCYTCQCRENIKNMDCYIEHIHVCPSRSGRIGSPS